MQFSDNPLVQHSYRLITQQFGQIQNFQSLAKGQSQNVFAFQAAGHNWVFKISKNPEIANKELFASDWLERLPVPGYHSNGRLGPYFWIIQTQIHGEIKNAQEWSESFTQLITFISRLRSQPFPIPLPTVGLPSWTDEMSALLQWPQRFQRHLFWREETQLSQAIFDRVTQLLPACHSLRWLIHGDFHPHNVLWQAGQIQGVLDWQHLGNGDFLYDLALALIFCPETDWSKHLEQISEHFELPLLNLKQRMCLYGLHGALKRALGHREKLRMQEYQKQKQILKALLLLPV